VTERFECDFGEPFDVAIANSVFTHLPLNHIRLCLHQLSFAMRPGGRFFATFFEVPASAPYSDSHEQRFRTTWPERDAYHYRAADLRWAAQSVADWRTRYLGDWGHPRGQMMMQFELRSAAGQRPEWELAARTIGREAKRRAGRLRDLRPGR
jgi:hypothetical protein